MTIDFDGTVVAIDGERVTYRVDRVRQDDPVGSGRLPDPGGTVVVHYGTQPGPLSVDQRLRVAGWTHRAEGVSSQIAYDFDGECGSGAGTTALDGSYLGSKGVDRLWPYALAGLVIIGGAVLAGSAVVARRQDRAEV